MRAEATMDFGASLGFPATQRSHLVGMRRFDDGVDEGSAERGGEGVRERGDVRAGSVLFDRVRSAAAARAAAEFADG